MSLSEKDLETTLCFSEVFTQNVCTPFKAAGKIVYVDLDPLGSRSQVPGSRSPGLSVRLWVPWSGSAPGSPGPRSPGLGPVPGPGALVPVCGSQVLCPGSQVPGPESRWARAQISHFGFDVHFLTSIFDYINGHHKQYINHVNIILNCMLHFGLPGKCLCNNH